MKKSRIMSLVVALLVVVAMTGCNTAAPTTASAPATVAPATDATTEPAPPVKGEPTKISYYRNGINMKCITNYNDALWIQELEKRMNVKLDIQGPKSGDDYMQAAQLMLSSGTLTDMFYYDWNRYDGGLAAAIGDGVVVNVSGNEKYKAMMPTWFGLLASNEPIRRAVTLDDGTSAMFCHVEANLKRGAYFGLSIRQDWLTKLKLQSPKTMDELYNVLVAFRDQDPNGNGKADEIPFTDENWLPATRGLLAPFGLLYNEYQLDPNTGKINYWTQVGGGKNFTDAVTTLNKWYVEKLIDAEFSTQPGSAEDAKWTSDRVGVGQVWPTQFQAYTEALKKINPDADVEGLPGMIGTAGKQYGFNSAHVRPAASNEGTVVTTQAEKDNTIEACLKLIDYMYTDEGSEVINWGVEGVSYNKAADGTKTWSDTVLKDPKFAFGDLVFKYALPTWGSWPKQMSYEAWASIETVFPASKAAHELWWTDDTGLLPPPLLLSSSESKEFARIMNDANTSISENFLKFVIGTRPLSEVPDFLKSINDLGVDKAMGMYQSAYDRYKAK